MMLPSQPQRLARKMAAGNVRQPTARTRNPHPVPLPEGEGVGNYSSPSLPDGEKSHG
jgi:hypothetical protein